MDLPIWAIERAAGLILVLCSVASFPGFMMFWLRRGHRGGPPRSRAHFIWERSFIMSGAILAAIGFVLLADSLQNINGRVLATIGATAYLFGAVLLVAAETLSLTLGYEKLYGLIVVYVVMAFLAQAAIGGALIQSGKVITSIDQLTAVWLTSMLANSGVLINGAVGTLMKILFATMPFDGHFNPLTGVAMHLKAASLMMFSLEQRMF